MVDIVQDGVVLQRGADHVVRGQGLKVGLMVGEERIVESTLR